MKSISIVIPAHNEGKRISRTLTNYLNFFKEPAKRKVLDFEIIVVINDSEDDTLRIVEDYKIKYKEIKLLNFKEKGKGFAIIEGFKEALKGRSNLIGFVDADMATPPNAFYGLIRNIKNFDGIIANRWDKKSKIKTKQTILRRVLSRGFNFIVRSFFLLSHRDTQCGAKLFKKEIIKKILPKLSSKGWSFDIDLLFYMRREGAKIKSIPTEWNDQKESKLNVRKTPFKMFFSVFRLRLFHSPFKFILRAHSKLPKKMQAGYWLIDN